ncbi:MAG: hypothetical protein F4045_02110, partial [Chloroflexi bacterium]|nr:hypothetical protein [Chloroflexota bacterium]
GGGLYTGPGGGLYTGPGGGLYTGPGGGLYTGPAPNPYYSIIPPREIYLRHVLAYGYEAQYRLLKRVWGL